MRARLGFHVQELGSVCPSHHVIASGIKRVIRVLVRPSTTWIAHSLK